MIKVKFIQYKNVVIADILEQGKEVVRGNYNRRFTDQYGRSFYIDSASFPAVSGRTLFLRGTDVRKDKEVAAWSYNTKEEAKIAVQAFQTLIDQHNAIYSTEGGNKLEAE